MKERPILFNSPMVRAILEGRKTVTRRPVKATKAHADGFMMLDHGKGWWPYNAFGDFASDHEGMEYPIACPYGKLGDRLWVRETFSSSADCRPPIDAPFIYAADLNSDGVQNWAARWKPSIHMPRAASRILLEVTDVRVERLRDSADLALLDELGDMLDDCDSVAGKEFSRIEHLQSAGAPLRMLPEMYGFKAYWDKVNGAGSFDANPWVWVVEFKRTSPNELSHIR